MPIVHTMYTHAAGTHCTVNGHPSTPRDVTSDMAFP